MKIDSVQIDPAVCCGVKEYAKRRLDSAIEKEKGDDAIIRERKERKPEPEICTYAPWRKGIDRPSPDFDGSGVVDGSDLGYLLGKWGSADKLADLDKNGIVADKDLKILLSKWGKVKKEDYNPDFNGDGNLNIMDFLAFQNSFAAGEKRADVDGNGVLNAKDFFAYRHAFKKAWDEKNDSKIKSTC